MPNDIKRIYIAGLMRHVPLFNFPAFDAARDKLKAEGWDVFSPADLDRAAGFDPASLPSDYDWSKIPDGFDFTACAQRDIEAIFLCDAIYLLKGWAKSTGARAEKALAEWLGKQVIYEIPPDDEVIAIDPATGARKARKLARFDLIPAKPLWDFAEHYGRGSAKYDDRNWELGYAWSWSFTSANRHMWKFWLGEDADPQTKTPHVLCAAWHMFALAEFMSTHPEKDDRPK